MNKRDLELLKELLKTRNLGETWHSFCLRISKLDDYLRGANLRGADLQGTNLRGADLRGANLKEADLEGADLEGADLEKANLEKAYLEGANLRGANLKEANLKEAYLKEAYLEVANLREANLREANLREANLRGANLEEVNLQKVEGNGQEVISINDFSHLVFYEVNKEIMLVINDECQPLQTWFAQRNLRLSLAQNQIIDMILKAGKKESH